MRVPLERVDPLVPGRIDHTRAGVGRLSIRVGASIALALAATGVLAARLLTGHQEFTDIVVGEVTLDGYYKSGDFRLAWAFLFFVAVSYAALTAIGDLRVSANQPKATRFGRALTAAAPGIAVAVVVSRWLSSEARLSASGLALPVIAVLVVLVISVSRIAGTSREPLRAVAERLALAALTAGFAFLSLVGLVATFATISLAPEARSFLETHSDDVVRLSVLAGAAFAIAAANGTIRRESLARTCLVAQVLTPLVFLQPFMGVFESGSGLFRSGVTDQARLLVALAVGVAIASTLRAARARAEEVALPLRRLILPWAVVASAVAAAFATPAASAFEMADDFHTGETLIQWQQLTTFGHRAFVSFFPIPGLVGALIGWVNDVLFTGTATSYPQATILLHVTVAGLTAALLVRLLGAHWALLLSTTLLLPTNRTYLLLPSLAILALPALLQRPLLWLAAWSALATIGTAFVSATGLAVTLGTAPVAVWVLASWLRHSARDGPSIRGEMRRAIPFLVVVAAIVLFLPNLLGLVEYLREGERSNITAYGLGLFQYKLAPALPASLPFGLRKTAWEAIRLGAWVVALPFLLGLLHASLRKGRGTARFGGPSPFAAFATGLIGTLLASIPYSLGRIDPGVLSRPGLLSLTTFASLLPVALLLYLRPRDTLTGLLVTLTWALPLWGFYVPLRPEDLVRGAVAPIRSAKPAAFFEESPKRFPDLGRGLIDREHLQRIRTLDNVLVAVARPGETYFDATNRATYYFGLDERVPAPFSGQFYAADQPSQARILQALSRDPPPVIWVGPVLLQKFSLRAYRVYKWAMLEGYRYFRVGKIELLIHPSRAPLMSEVMATDVVSPVDWTSLQPGDLAYIPVSWGRSFDSLAWRFGQPLHLLPDRSASTTDSNAWLLPSGTSGSRHDFVLFQVSCSTGNEAVVPASAEWDSPKGERGISFRAAPGQLLIPLGADPAWLLEPKAGVLRLTASPTRACGTLRVEQASLLSLKK